MASLARKRFGVRVPVGPPLKKENFKPTICSVSSAGRAGALQALGREFKSLTLHQGRPKSRAEFIHSEIDTPTLAKWGDLR